LKNRTLPPCACADELFNFVSVQQEFEQEKERIILARSREFAMEQQNWPRGDAAARRGAGAGSGAISPTPLKESDSDVGEFSMDDLPACLYSTRDRGGLFKMKAKDAVQVLEDLVYCSQDAITRVFKINIYI
jgi:hypothetical protein